MSKPELHDSVDLQRRLAFLLLGTANGEKVQAELGCDSRTLLETFALNFRTTFGVSPDLSRVLSDEELGNELAAELATPVNLQTSRPDVLGLCGDIGCGKDSFAEVAVKQEGYHRCAFADPVRRIASLLFPLTLHDMMDRVLKETPMVALHQGGFVRVAHGTAGAYSPRRILQLFGTEVVRALHRDMWVRNMGHRITRLSMGGPVRIVIPDVRFDLTPKDEVGFVRRHGKLLHIQRPHNADLAALLAGGHASQQSIAVRPDLGDEVLLNDGTFEQFLDRAVGWLYQRAHALAAKETTSVPRAVAELADWQSGLGDRLNPFRSEPLRGPRP